MQSYPFKGFGMMLQPVPELQVVPDHVHRLDHGCHLLTKDEGQAFPAEGRLWQPADQHDEWSCSKDGLLLVDAARSACRQ